MAEEEFTEEGHFNECFGLAFGCYRENNYEAALEIIRDSGLDLDVYYQLAQLKHKCLQALGRLQDAKDLFFEHRAKQCSERVLLLIRNAQFKEALQHIENSGLNFMAHKKLLELHNWCKSVLKEVPSVRELIKEASKCLYNANDPQSALNLIDSSKFNLEVHVNVLELKVYCLKQLARDKDAYDIANLLWQRGYKMSRRLHLIIGDYLKETLGSEKACRYYQMISDEPDVSYDDHQFFSKLARDIRGNKKMKKKGGTSSQAEQADWEKLEESQIQSVLLSEIEEKSRNDDALDNSLDGISRITLEEKNEVHDVIRDEGQGTDASGSTPESSKKIMLQVGDEYDFVLEAQEEDLYSGHKKIDIGHDFHMTLIRCTKFQLQNLEILKSLDHTSILKISDITSFNIEATTSNFFVVESVQRVNHYYTSLLMDFRSKHTVEGDDKEAVLIKWWKLIGPKFKKIFRDLVDGWIFFITKGQGHICSCDAFVTNNGSGKILPSMEPGCKLGDIVENLVKQMKSIVYLPHLNHNLKPDWLPKELLHLFSFLSKEKVNKVPLWWLLDHHFFWESEELVDFVCNLKRLYRKPNFGKLFSGCLYPEMSTGYSKLWSDYIPGGILEDIWRKGDPPESAESSKFAMLKSSGYYRVFPYRNNIDIVRYMVAVYNHFGDDEYNADKDLDVVDMEQQLRSIFPNIYGYFVNAIYQSALEMDSNSEKLEVLRKLSRRRDY